MLRQSATSNVAQISLGLLSGFELRHGQGDIRLPPSAQRLVAFVALQRRAVQRVYVAGVLWMDTTQEAASANLRTALWRLRRPQLSVIDATTTHLALSPSVVVDLHVASAVAQRVSRGGATVEPSDVDAIALAGELLPDWYEDWVILERERFRQSRLHALEAACNELALQRRFAEAVEAGLTAVAAEPLRESAHRAVIRAHLAERNRGEALRQYEVFRRLLADQLGLEPSEEMDLLRREAVSIR